MKLADDRRARIPFAIIGVVLLLGSATYVATMDRRGPRPTAPNVVEANARLEAAVDTAVRRATARASATAAANPVAMAADTPAGGSQDEDEPFREYLEVRIYLAVRRALSNVRIHVGGVTGRASLPAPTGVDAMVGRVEVERGSENASVVVRVENVSLSVRRNGLVVLQRNLTVERTVATPVLALHDRVELFQRKLNASLDESTGLSARVAAILYAIAWSRAYMQYAGAPVENVVANRHLAVATNFALLGVQRTVFGRADPAARAAMRAAIARMVAQDAGMVGGLAGEQYLARLLQKKRNSNLPPLPIASMVTGPTGTPSPDSEITVEVNATADRALAAYLNGSGVARNLDAVLNSTYSADVRYRTAKRAVRREDRPGRNPPGEEWELASERTSKTVTVSQGEGPLPPAAANWHRLASFTRRVNVTRTVVRVWTNGSARRVHERTYTRIYEVGVVLEGLHSPTLVPRLGIRTVHDRGANPLDGPNLAGVPSRAIREFVSKPGKSTLAERAALGTLDTGRHALAGERPANLTEYVEADVLWVYRQVRNVSTTVPRGAAGTGKVNPAAVLLEKLRERRAELVDAPTVYDSVAHKARVAARAGYVEEVIARLERRAERTRKRNDAIAEVLGNHGVSMTQLRQAMAAQQWEVRNGRPMFAEGISGPVNVTVAGAPAYLTRQAVTHDQVRAVAPATEFYPLRTKNVNVFTMPYADAGSVVVDAVAASNSGTDLRTAAVALRGANRTLAEGSNRSLRKKRGRLRKAITKALVTIATRLDALLGKLAERDLSGNLTASEREAAIESAFAAWDTTAARALAVTNGSFARRLVREIGTRAEFERGGRTMMLSSVRSFLHDAVRDSRVRPPRALVNSTSTAVRTLATFAAGEMTRVAMNKSFDRIKQKYDGKYKLVPTGLPLSPLPAYYYAVGNVWINDVRGTYASFAVSARSGAPVGPTTVTYRRDGDPVALDVDGDGTRELLGWSTRISFKVVVPVMVVVPPTPVGMGDRDGNADERSAGWATPPPVRTHNATWE